MRVERIPLSIPALVFWSLVASLSPAVEEAPGAVEVLEHYCFGCHNDTSRKGGLNLEEFLVKGEIDETLIFENLLTGKMPPVEKDQPNPDEKKAVLKWLAKRQENSSPKLFRRISRHEFVHSANDLLSTNLDLAAKIPEDRGTSAFDSNRKIQLSREMLGSYFAVADEMLDFAIPEEGFPVERTWVTNKLRDSHETYRIYHRPYREGTLFSWTRANNGNSYSFFYEGFTPPAAGWYELTFDASKVSGIAEDLSLQVHAGKYYYADDRPQPQRLLGVISLGNPEMESHTVRAFLRPGESVSVHCFSRDNFRQKSPEEGVYIRQLKVRGPILDSWPPMSYRTVFGNLSIKGDARESLKVAGGQTNLQKIGGSVRVSSFQEGMGKERMQDGSNLTFWHTRFSPTVAKPPHYVILDNPMRMEIEGLSFATWQGGNGNGLVKAYEIYFSDDGKSWGEKVMAGALDVRLANEQPIVFPSKTSRRFIKFLITDSVQLDQKSIASIGRLDVITRIEDSPPTSFVTVDSRSPKALENVVRRFAERAFSSKLSRDEVAPYLEIALRQLRGGRSFSLAAKTGLKAVLCSPRFLMAPGEHANLSYGRAAALARALWLSVPDEELQRLSAAGNLEGDTLRVQIRRMLADERSERMIRSFSDQWLNLRSLDKVTPSLKLYPLYDDLLNYYLPIETRMYLGYLVEENMPAEFLIDSNFSFLNQRLARHYGIEGVSGHGMRKIFLPPELPRGGLLTMGSILKVTTDGFDTSPILRGAWISRNIVGTPLSPPPESVAALEPEHGRGETLREQIEKHKLNKTCHACHKSIDPYGFALESFDAVGEWRQRYKIKLPHSGTFQYRPQGYFKMGSQVDSSGEISGEAFTDIFGLKKVLLTNKKKIAYTFARKYFEYVNGIEPTLSQRLHLWNFLEKEPGRERLKDLITEVLVYSLRESNK